MTKSEAYELLANRTKCRETECGTGRCTECKYRWDKSKEEEAEQIAIEVLKERIKEQEMTEREKETICDCICKFPGKASNRYPNNPEASQRALDRYCEKCPLVDETEWHDLEANPDDLPTDGWICVVEIHGSDVIKLEDGETLEEALKRVRKKVRTDTGYYSPEDNCWVNEFGFPMIIQPSAWRSIDMSPRKEEEQNG